MKIQQLTDYIEKLSVANGAEIKDQTFAEIINLAQQQERPLIFTVISSAWIKAGSLRDDWGIKNHSILKGCTPQAQEFKNFIDRYSGTVKPLVYILATNDIHEAQQWLQDKEIIGKENISIISINENILKLLDLRDEQFDDKDIIRPYKATFVLLPRQVELQNITIERAGYVTDQSVNQSKMKNHTKSIGECIAMLQQDSQEGHELIQGNEPSNSPKPRI